MSYRRSRRDYDDDYDNRRSSRRRSSRRRSSGGGGGRKSYDEIRVEHITWALLVGVFAVLYLTREGQVGLDIPNWFTPVAGALILLGSGFYQYANRWRVSPATWVGGSLMLVMAYYSMYMAPNADVKGFAMLTFAAVIAFGVLTGET